ncbi:hypothetical protein FOA43_002101 [Brettanomyces nanus]|uniref:Ras-GAP domain-containing protein n=1 Tax=Eeniella nana TaxID=13502 RepID=A0A875RUN4_EENNA|nr:uncharacterized protein FOA43_002101 [Brettanomyces nanus]QPG74767.1 hypothetical protein FOA43_002101 [Brettanomyces nanus]
MLQQKVKREQRASGKTSTGQASTGQAAQSTRQSLRAHQSQASHGAHGAHGAHGTHGTRESPRESPRQHGERASGGIPSPVGGVAASPVVEVGPPVVLGGSPVVLAGSPVVSGAPQAHPPVAFISSICSRIELSLPLRSGYTLGQLDVDPSFSQARSHLVHLATLSYLDSTLVQLFDLLKRIIDTTTDRNSIPISILRSIYVVLDIVLSIINALWDSAVNNIPSNVKIYRDFGINAAPSLVNSAVYATASPKPVQSATVASLLPLLVDIRTDQAIILQLDSISDSPTTSAVAASLSMHFTDPTRAWLINSIDSTVSSICKYLAASNPDEFYAFLRSKFHLLNIESIYIPSVDLFGMICLQNDNFIAHLGLIADIIKVSRRQSQIALLLSYFADGIFCWATYRTSDFLQAQSLEAVNHSVDPLFDLLFRSLDFKFYHKAATNILASMLLLLPQQFTKYLDSEKPQKTTFGLKKPAVFKATTCKQRFILDFVHVLQHHPTSAPFLTRLMLVGCIISTYDASNPVATFTWHILDGIRSDLVLAEAGDPSIDLPVDGHLLLGLQRDLFAISMMMDPVSVTKRIVKLGSHSKSAVRQWLPVVGGLRQLIEIPVLSVEMFPYLQTASPVILQVIHSLAEDTDVNNDAPDDLATSETTTNDSTPNDNVGSSVISLDEALKTDSNSITGTTKRLTRKMKESIIGSTTSMPSSSASIQVNSSTSIAGEPSVISSHSMKSSASVVSSVYSMPEAARSVLSDSFHIYKICPFMFYTYSVDSSHPTDYVALERTYIPFLAPISLLLVDSDADLSSSVEAFLLSFPLTIANDSSSASLLGYLVSAIAVDSVCQISVLPTIDQAQREHLIKLISQLVNLVSRYTSTEKLVDSLNDEQVRKYHLSGGCNRLMNNFERALFLGLLSDSVDTIRVSRRLLQAYLMIISSEFHLRMCFSHDNLPLVKNIIRGKLPTGRLAIRKKLRDHMCTLMEPTSTLLDVWNIIYSKISSASHIEEVMEGQNELDLLDSLDSNAFVTSDDYGEYVASLGGIIMAPSFASDSRQPSLQHKLMMFLDYSLLSLFSSDAKRREHSREVLCVSVHPLLCGLILDLVEKHLERFESALSKKQYNLCELYINVLRAICQIDVSNGLFFHSTQLWSINCRLLSLMNFVVSRPGFLRLKLKFCKLQVMFLSKIDDLSLRGNIFKKNEYARIAANYLEDSFEVPPDEDVESESARATSGKVLSFGVGPSKPLYTALQLEELQDLHLNIKVEASTMLKIVFHRLPLDTPIHSAKEDKLAAGVIFSNYFNIFVRILERMNGPNTNGSKPQQASTALPQSLASSLQMQSIIHNVIQALVNLLSSNSEIGLNYSLPLGYHHDSLIRVSFINVFSKIIQDVYAPKIDVAKQSLQKLSRILFFGKPALLLSAVEVCPRSEVDAFANALLQVTDNEQKKLSILTGLLRFEILNVGHSVEILRSNTVATRMVALYSRSEAAVYIVKTLRSPLEELVESGEYFEIEKMDSLNDQEKMYNVELFMKYLKLVVDSISLSLEMIPHGIRVISKVIFDTASVHFPQSKYAALGAYLFLRLYNPAIVSPDQAKIVESNDVRFKRSVIQIARTLQMLVNDVLPTSKFPSLRSKAGEIAEMNRQIAQFMDFVVAVEDDDPADVQVEFNYNAGIRFFHTFFYDHWMEIRSKYSLKGGGKLYEDSKEDKIKNIKQVDSLLCVLGLPERIKGYQIPVSIKNDKSEKGILLYDFMSRSSLKDSNPGDSLRVLATKDGLPLVVVRLAQVPENLSNDTMIYRLIQSLSGYWEQPYCFLIDCTGYTDVERFDSLFSLYCSLIPPAFRINCKRTYYFNVTPQFYRCLRAFGYSMPDSIEFRFLSSDDDSKTIMTSGLVSYSNQVSNDARVVFHDVSLYQAEARRFVPVKLKVGNRYVQIFSGQPQRLKLGSRMRLVKTVEVYKVRDMDEIAASNITGVFNELSMVNSATGERLILASPKKVEIMRTLYFSRARNYQEDISDESQESGEMSLELSIGKLINMSFSGLLYSSDSIRNASFALLASLTKLFHFSVGRKIETVDGVTFPFGEVNYISSVSAEMAKNHPTLTYAVLRGFFEAFDDASLQNKSSIVMYIGPWIKNLYKYVYLANSSKGPARTADLVCRFVRSSRDSMRVTQAFMYFIWSQISLEDQLVEVIINEIVAAAIDHEAEGHNWTEITRFWPLTPTIEVCSFLLRRLREKSYTLSINESEIEVHTTWIETTVMARFLAYLVFDSLLFVQTFLSDIFYVATIYMDCGPLEMRRCMSNLLIRTFHSYLSHEGLSEKQRDSIRSQIELLNGARFRMLFGLTREDNDEMFNQTSLPGGEMINRANAVSTLCDLLVGFIKSFSSVEDCELKLIKCSSYVMNVAFDSNSQLQGQAILVLGSLTKEGIDSILVGRFLGLLLETFDRVTSSIGQSKKHFSLLICVMHAFSRALDGVRSDSSFLPRFFWLSYSMLFLDNAMFYYYGLKFLRSILTKMSEHLEKLRKEEPESKAMTIGDYVNKYRDAFDPVLREYEALNGITFSTRYFDAIMVCLCAKGLTVPFCHRSSLETMETLLKVRYAEGAPGYSTYLFYIYIMSSSNEEMVETMKRCGVSSDSPMYTFSMGTKMPKVVSEWYSMSSPNAIACCLSALKYFRSQKVNEVTSSRALMLFGAMEEQRPDQVYGLWDEFSGVLQGFIENSSTTYLLEMSLDVVSKMMENTESEKHDEYQKNAWKTLEDADLMGLKELGFSSEDTFNGDMSEEAFETLKKRSSYISKMIGTLRTLSVQDE